MLRKGGPAGSLRGARSSEKGLREKVVKKGDHSRNVDMTALKKNKKGECFAEGGRKIKGGEGKW